MTNREQEPEAHRPVAPVEPSSPDSPELPRGPEADTKYKGSEPSHPIEEHNSKTQKAKTDFSTGAHGKTEGRQDAVTNREQETDAHRPVAPVLPDSPEYPRGPEVDTQHTRQRTESSKTQEMKRDFRWTTEKHKDGRML